MAVLDDPENNVESTTNDKTTAKLNRKQLKKKAKKKKKKERNNPSNSEREVENNADDLKVKVEIEFIPDKLEEFARHDPYFEFNRVFEKFKVVDLQKNGVNQVEDSTDKSKNIKKLDDVPIKARAFVEDDEEADREKTDEKSKMSKKKLKKLNRLTVAELKQLVSRPDVVEMHDVTSRDPKLLVSLKAARNTVPVPRHWCFKRKYLQGKRGFEKPAFDLPHFIKATGIMEMRQALQEKEDQKTLKSKMRERVRPKMGKIDIDYQKLHDAFFKWQTKPRMTIHGDIYYEGKEFETRLKEKKPGNLSDDLRTALGMPIGPNADKYPPPWLIAMQRYGPPPSYPNLKIPGLNAPIPDGTSFGYHAGGWGKPPVDETGKPLYGDVFGPNVNEPNAPSREDEVDKNFWGEMESESEEESEEEEEEKEGGEEPDMTGLVTPGETGLATPSGTTSVMTLGMETPESIELRKKRIEDAMDQGGDTPNLYTILPERRVGAGAAMMGSTHVYEIPTAPSAGLSAPAATTTGKKASGEGIEVVLEPEELDLDMAAMKAKYDQTLKEQQSNLSKEDLSDMVAEHQAKQQKKRKKQSQSNQDTSSTGKNKKMKEFKF